MKVVHGTVTAGGVKADTGTVRFVPVKGTKGPIGFAEIVDGQYRIEARGGVPIGRHRVEVDARRKTGREIPHDSPANDNAIIDETVRIAPDAYAGPNSPLVVEVTADSDGKIDIQIPGR